MTWSTGLTGLATTACWIGGSPCSGKTSVAAVLAGRYGLTPYTCDDAFDRHARQVPVASGPTLRKVTGMAVEQRLAQAIVVQVADVWRAYLEEFPLILAELADLPGRVLVEGAAVLTALVHDLGVAPERAIWIVPTEQFQRERYAERAWSRELVAGAPDPSAAFRRWMRRDASFALEVAGQARAAGYRVLVVDGAVPVEQVADEVARHFGLVHPTGPLG